jgi:hypothetical protein
MLDPVEPDLDAVLPPENHSDVTMDAGFEGSHASLESCHAHLEGCHLRTQIAHHLNQIVELAIQPAQSTVGQIIGTVAMGI